MNFLSANIRFLRTQARLSQAELAKAIKVSRSNLAKYESNVHDPGIEIILRISRYFRISIDHLLLTRITDENCQDIQDRPGIIMPIQVDQDRKDLIELVPHQASAGYSGSYNDPEYIENLQHLYLPFINPYAHCRAFPISGDSMPPVLDGSYVIGTYIGNPSSIKIGCRYIIVSRDEGIVFKRIIKIKNGQLFLQSDNPHYETYTMPIQEIIEIWEFVASITIEDSAATYEQNQLVDKLETMQQELEKVKKHLLQRQ